MYTGQINKFVLAVSLLKFMLMVIYCKVFVLHFSGRHLLSHAVGAFKLDRPWFAIGESCVAYQSINQSNFYSTNIPSEARLSGATVNLVFDCKIEAVPWHQQAIGILLSMGQRPSVRDGSWDACIITHQLCISSWQSGFCWLLQTRCTLIWL